MNDALWKYVGQISGVLSICGAVVVIITAIVLTEINRIFHDHITTAEVTWASFLAGVEVAGAISIAYGIALNRKKAGGGDENRQAFIAFFSGIALIIVATAGFTVPTSGGDTAHAHPRRSHAQNNQRLCMMPCSNVSQGSLHWYRHCRLLYHAMPSLPAVGYRSDLLI